MWPYRGIERISEPTPMGHEYVGIVEEVGSAVRNIKPGQFVVGSFFASDNTCPICQAGYQSRCVHAQPIGAIGTQAQYARIPLADGTLVATPDIPSGDLIPSLLAASDVLGTGWFAADAANAQPGRTVAVVGDGAVGLLGMLAARQMGAERIIAMSRNEARQRLAREFGATDIVTERGDEGVARIKDMTNGLGAHSVIEAVGTQESMLQAIRSTRSGGHVGYVGVSHGVELPGEELVLRGSPPAWRSRPGAPLLA
jgi:threonine dehydrogenase-like Zn-dependent dehydrogenase